MSQHHNIAGSLPSAPARSLHRSANHTNLSASLAANMSRNDRELMTQMASDHVPIYVPHSDSRVLLQDHILNDGLQPRWRARIDSGFIARRDMYVVGGHAHEPVAESHHHVEAICKLRNYIYGGISVAPGLATTISNVYGVPGGWIRCLSEDYLSVLDSLHQKSYWGMNGERVIANGNVIGPNIPLLAPRVWFGFTGTQRWQRELEECKPHFEWVDSYLEHRPFALACLFEPDRVSLSEAKAEALSIRHDALARAKRFANVAATATAAGSVSDAKRLTPQEAMESAFKSLGGAFKK